MLAGFFQVEIICSVALTIDRLGYHFHFFSRNFYVFFTFNWPSQFRLSRVHEWNGNTGIIITTLEGSLHLDCLMCDIFQKIQEYLLICTTRYIFNTINENLFFFLCPLWRNFFCCSMKCLWGICSRAWLWFPKLFMGKTVVSF